MLRLVALGYGDRPIAMMLGVAESTAASHCKNIIAKLGGRNRTHACYLAVQAGLLTLDGRDVHVRA